VLSFGAGVHYCLGSNLARLELASALSILTTRMPNARLSGPTPWGPMTGISGPIVLPITFDGD
jgi:cytochrome P450